MRLDEILQKQADITGAEHVEVKIRQDGKVLWINVNGVMLLRISQIENLTLEDERPRWIGVGPDGPIRR